MKTLLRTSACLSVVVFAASCSQVLGLDDYNQSPTTSGTAGKGGSEVGGAGGSGGDTTGGMGGGGGMGTTGGMGGSPICTPQAAKACYSGATGTENVGICKGGMQTCSADGFTWGPCEGETTPAAQEDCATIGDENCDGKVCAEALWSAVYGDANDHYAERVALDAAGNIYLVGSFEGGLDFNGKSVVSAGGFDIFIAKFDPSGNVLWAQRFGTATAADAEAGQVIAADAAGNIVIAGYTDTALNFGKGVVAAPGLFIAKFDTNGTCVWSKGIGGVSASPPITGVTASTGLAINAAGEIFYTGYYAGAANFGDGSITPNNTDMFIVKYSSAGAVMWKKAFIVASSQQAQDVALDPSGNVVVTGNFAGMVDFGGQTRNAADVDVFVVKYDTAGVLSWVKSFSATGNQTPSAVATDSLGGVIITGFTTGTVNLGGTAIGTAGKTDGFYAKFDATGVHQWSQSFVADQYQRIGVAAGPNKEVVLLGSYANTTTFGNQNLTALGSLDIFLVKLSEGGQLNWAKSLGDANLQLTGAVAIDAPSGNIVITGTTTGTVDFGNGPRATNGGRDVYLAKFYP